jgi:hypothetical protein
MACGQRNTANYEMIYVFIAIVLICIMTLLGPRIQSIFGEILTTLTLGEFETAFAAIQHPAGTEPLVERKLAGKLAAGDKGCDFFVGEVRRSEANPEEITAAYANQTVPNAGGLHVLFITDGIFPSDENAVLPETLNEPAEWNLTQDEIQQPLYLVYILALDYQAGNSYDCR